jgi:hypothetical protein
LPFCLYPPPRGRLLWKVFFAQAGEEENVNIDAILLDEPSWYVVAATETSEPEKWLAYAQDRKVEDSKYSVSAFRRDIQQARLIGVEPSKSSTKEMQPRAVGLPKFEGRTCPWVKQLYVRSGKPMPAQECQYCEFEFNKICETKPNLMGE